MTADSRRDFTAFYAYSWGRTVACAYAIAGDLSAAEDLAQEAYTRAWARWSTINTYEDPAAWVRQVATRLAVSRWRRSRVARAFLSRSRPPEPVAGPDDTTVALVRALSQIPEAQRRTVVLHHLAGFSVGEIADLDQCPTGTVKARLARGRAALAAHLRPTPESTSDGLENSHV
jgi:RNA polymerase sigma-70 factor (ECF subfamily)